MASSNRRIGADDSMDAFVRNVLVSYEHFIHGAVSVGESAVVLVLFVGW